MKIIIQLLSLGWLLFVLPSQADDASHFNIKTVAQGIGTPWGMAFLSADSLLVTEREGSLLPLDLKSRPVSNIDDFPWDIVVLGQGGLLDVAVDKSSDWIYLSYSKNINGQGATTLARAKLRDNTLTDWQDLLVSKSRTRTNHHFAGRLACDQQNHIFMSIGDRGVRGNAQDLSNHAGSIIRLNLDGSVPKDNPFMNDDAALPEIWTYGHRNPQGLFFNA